MVRNPELLMMIMTISHLEVFVIVYLSVRFLRLFQMFAFLSINKNI